MWSLQAADGANGGGKMFLVTAIVMIIVFFGLDYLIRRTGWKKNTKDERVSLIINFVTIPVYYFMASAGILFAMVGTTAETKVGTFLFELSTILSAFTWLIVLLVSIVSIVLRKQGRTRASKWVHMGSLIYIMLYAAIANLSNLL